MEVDEIRIEISTGNYRFYDHTVKRMIRRSIDRIEVEEVIKVEDGIPQF
jgi:hypothetical protein